MYFFVFVAAVGALYFVIAAVRQPRPGRFIAAIAWLAYAAYEYFIANGVLCDANCNIRVDLLLVWPLLFCASLFGIYGPGQWTRTGKVLGGLSLFAVTAMSAVALYIMFVETPAAESAARTKNCDAKTEAECAPESPSPDSAAGNR